MHNKFYVYYHLVIHLLKTIVHIATNIKFEIITKYLYSLMHSKCHDYGHLVNNLLE